uniref:Uncharacterized protein LOC112838140 n=1 Tax=Callorhinus ursinus TaxID=34884 RepID=A0A3Q7QLR4_CALUR|nr:uncharacterized protein LOC112838140 [Callorhinus ursinus]
MPKETTQVGGTYLSLEAAGELGNHIPHKNEHNTLRSRISGAQRRLNSSHRSSCSLTQSLCPTGSVLAGTIGAGTRTVTKCIFAYNGSDCSDAPRNAHQKKLAVSLASCKYTEIRKPAQRKYARYVRSCQLSARLCPEGLCKEMGHWTTPEPPGASGRAWPFLVPAQISKNRRNKQIRNFRKQQRLKAYDSGAVGKSGLWRKMKALLRLQNKTDYLLWDWHQLTPSPPGSLAA